MNQNIPKSFNYHHKKKQTTTETKAVIAASIITSEWGGGSVREREREVIYNKSYQQNLIEHITLKPQKFED